MAATRFSGRPMRVLFLARLFSGLKQGLAEGKWEPAGVPAICRLLEGLNKDPEVDLLSVFSLKEPDERFRRVTRNSIAPLGETVILPYRGRFGGRLRPLGTASTEIEQTARILALAARFRPHIVYATYANIQAAGLLARCGGKVVLRFMGVVPHHREIAGGAAPLFRWQLRAPFSHVVSTEDGSDPAAILPRLLREGTPWTVRLNGCDAAPLAGAEANAFRAEIGLGTRPVIAFLGRLQPYKGCLEFIDAVVALLGRNPDCADIVVVGDGPMQAEMESRVRSANQTARVHFVGSQPHERAYRYLGAADIYVSTNMYGNLSNANLEAIAAGACLVLPTSDRAVPIDTETDRLIPNDAAKRYDREGLPGSLTEALAELVGSPGEFARRKTRTAALAGRLIRPWAKSVETDIKLLKSIVGSRDSSVVPAVTN